MNVLFLHQFNLDFAGGSGTYLRFLARAMAEMGHEVAVVSAHQPDRHGCSTYALPFDFTLTFGPQRRPGEKTFDDLSIGELRALSDRAAAWIERLPLREVRPDLLVVNHISLLADAARLVAARAGIPYRIISYGTDTQLLLGDDRYVDWLGDAVRRCARIFAISQFVAKEVQSVFPDAVAKIDVLGGAVDHRLFHPGPAPADADRVVFVGRLVTEKGIWTLLEAIEMLDGVVLDVVGEGPLFGPLQDAVRRSARGDNVNLLGYLPPDRLREVLVRSAAAVVPSLWEEPLGLVVLEAMACGVPVVATGVGGIPEVVRHGENGLLVDAGDPDSLADAIRRLLHDPALRGHLREGCLRTAIPAHADLARAVVG